MLGLLSTIMAGFGSPIIVITAIIYAEEIDNLFTHLARLLLVH
jgi:hypothetical protein